jgi:hypothetical protein
MALSSLYTPVFSLREDPWTRKFPAASGTYNPGDLLQMSDGAAAYVVGLRPITYAAGAASLDEVAVTMIGVGDVAKASGVVFADGGQVYYDTANKVAVATPPAAGFYIGTARGAAGNGATSVRVVLNGVNFLANDPGTEHSAAAAGSTQADAAQLAGSVNLVGGADGTKGAALPAAAAGKSVAVVNTSGASALNVYAKSGSTAKINGVAGSTAYSIAAGKAALFVSDGTDYWALKGA